jgi:hypothetical protein
VRSSLRSTARRDSQHSECPSHDETPLSKLPRALLVLSALPMVSGAQFVAPRAMPMPFAEKRAIDQSCDNDGSGTSAQKRASNKAKNDFTAPAPAIALTFGDFKKLQDRIDQGVPSVTPRPGQNDDGYDIVMFPAGRSMLEDLITVNDGNRSVSVGEGKRVVLEAHVKSARHANSWPLGASEQGESVNCKQKWMNRNDIHIELVEKFPQDVADDKKRVTAEISPHFRPIVWERFDTNDKTAPEVVDVTDINGNKPLAGKPGIKELIGQKVRIYGHLYFDDVHKPCKKSCRLSTWEIHPVYWIDVEENKVWIPFHEWAARR